MIPYLPLKDINRPYESLITEALARVVDSGWYLFGHEVEAFEREWSDYCGVSHTVACGNGLDALRLVLRAWMEMHLMEEGDEVIVPANTYIASLLAVSDCGLVPVPVEPDPVTMLMSPQRVEEAITSRTRALLPVHLYGRQADIPSLLDLARTHHLCVLEDCAQSHGVHRLAGNELAQMHLSDVPRAQAWSFYPGKNLGAMGDAGAVTTHQAALADVVRQLAFYGSERKYVNRFKGYNSRMDEFQAAVLRIKLPDLDRCNQRRIAIASRYDEALRSSRVALSCGGGEVSGAPSVQHIYSVFSDRRDALQEFLHARGVMTQIHYPIPPHRQQAYAEWAHLSMPVTDRIAATQLSLPCHQSMTDDEVLQVIEAVNAFRG